jgi:hypothetical protein
MRLAVAWPWVCAAALALLWAGGADARGKRARVPGQTRVRPEFDPKLPGHAKEFARASVALEEPADLSEISLAPDAIKVVLHVEGYALGPAPAAAAPMAAPFALLLIDDEAALRIDDASAPLLLRGVRPGPHLLRVVLSRPWGEVVKAPGAIALSRIWVGPKLEGPAGKAAERAVWPDPRKPLLTCVFPLPEEREGGPTLEAYAVAAAQVEAEAATDAGAPAEEALAAAAAGGAAQDAGATGDETLAAAAPTGAAPDAGAPSPSPQAAAEAKPAPRAPQRPVLDFFLSGATLKPRGRGDKLRLVVDKKELPLVREWKPVRLKLGPGAHRLTVDLLDRRGTKVRNAVNRTDRSFTLPP